MGNELLISVIVPVYNAEKYIDRAIKSVLCQMDGRIELILVNDGSVDRSGEICDEYAVNNPNIRVIHKENGGLSSARNAGIKIARGEYISFLDADDYIDPEFCTEIWEVITTCQPDCIDFGWRYISNGVIMPDKFHKLPKNVLLGERELFKYILPPILNLKNDPDNFIFDFSCTKVFKKRIIEQNLVNFDENRRVWEDRPFVINYLRYCKSYYSLDKCFYNYVNNPSSLSHQYHKDFFRIIIENFCLYKTLFGNDFDFDTQYVNNHWCRAIENMILHSLEQRENKSQIHSSILNTLSDPQVIHWYANREAQSRFQRSVGHLIVSGKGKKALRKYINYVKNQNKLNMLLRAFNKIKRTIIRKHTI